MGFLWWLLIAAFWVIFLYFTMSMPASKRTFRNLSPGVRRGEVAALCCRTITPYLIGR
jgi:hypothetical protein